MQTLAVGTATVAGLPRAAAAGERERDVWWRRLAEEAWRVRGCNVVELSIDPSRTRALLQVLTAVHDRGGGGGGRGGGGESVSGKESNGYLTSLYFAGVADKSRIAYWRSTLASLTASFDGGGGGEGGTREEGFKGGEGERVRVAGRRWRRWRALRTSVSGLEDDTAVISHVKTLKWGAGGGAGRGWRRGTDDGGAGGDEESVLGAVKLLLQVSKADVMVVPCSEDAAISRHCSALVGLLVSAGAPSSASAAAANYTPPGTHFTCFTSTKVQILTPLRYPTQRGAG